MRRSRVVGALALIAGAALLVSACGGGGSGSSSKDSANIYGCEPQNPLIPGNTNESCGQTVIDNMWTGLVKYEGQNGKPVNAMAKSIKTDDSQHFTITIKSGWKFQDGTPVTAKSFVDAWNWVAYQGNNALDASYLSHIQGFDQVNPATATGNKDAKPTAQKMSGLKVVNDTTFDVTLSSPFAVFPVTLGYGAFYPMPASFFKDPKKFEQHPIGNGPFKFVSWQHRQSIKLTRYDGWKGSPKPTLKDVNFKIYQNLEPAYRDLLAGNLDFDKTMPVSALKGGQWKQKLGKRTLDVPQGAIGGIDFALYDKKLATSNNVNLRHAISLAINRKQIADVVFSGSRLPADGWVPPTVNGYKKGVCQWCHYDAKKAKQLWDSNGGKNVPKLTVTYNADGGHKAWMEAVCSQIKNALGVQCVAQPVPDFSTLRDMTTGKKMKGMFRSAWIQDYPSIQDFLEPIYHSGAGANDAGYSNQKFDNLLAQAAKAKSVDEANKLYQQAEAQLSDDMPNIPIYFYRQESGWSKKLSNVVVNAFGDIDLTKVKVNS